MSPPCYLKMASLGLWALPFYSLARISPTFCSVASLPTEPTSLSFLGWHPDGVGPLPPPAATTTTARRQGAPVGRRARGTWTATLDYVQKTCTSELCSSRLRTAKPSTHETRGQACWSCTLSVEIQPREGADPSITDQTCSLRATPTCCTFASLALRM